MTISDELLSAYLDGELSGEELALVENALATDPAAKKRFSELRRSDEMVNVLASAIDDEPFPVELEELLETSTKNSDNGNVVAFAQKNRNPAINRWALPLAASIALAVGFAGGGVFNPFGSSNPASDQLAAIVPGNPLHDLLEDTASGQRLMMDGKLSGEVRLTFIDDKDRPCREYSLQSEDEASQAVACREDDGKWNVELAARTEPQRANDDGFSTASSGNEIFGSAVNQMMASDALDSESEQRMISRSWD